MNELLNKYCLTGEVFDHFRITKTKAKEFLESLEEEGWSVDEISYAFSLLELHYKNKYLPVHWKNSIKFYLKKAREE